MYTNTGYNIHGGFPFLFLPLLIPLCSPLFPFLAPLYLLGSPPSCDRIRPPWSQVACKLTSPSQPFPQSLPLQIPGTRFIKRLTITTSRTRRLLSGTSTTPYQFSWSLTNCTRLSLSQCTVTWAQTYLMSRSKKDVVTMDTCNTAWLWSKAHVAQLDSLYEAHK
jgi:hypothetical protein